MILKTAISLFKVCICSYILSIRALNILIFVILNFLPNNSNICVMSESSLQTLVLSTCFDWLFLLIQFCSVSQWCLTLCDPMDGSTQGFPVHPNSWSLLKLMSIKSVMSPNHLILYHPLLLLPSIFPSSRVFSNESVLHIKLPKYWNFSFSISFSNEYSGLISFRINWFDLLAVQGTLKSLLQHHSWKHQFFVLSFLL